MERKINVQLDSQRQVDNERIRSVAQFIHDMRYVQQEILNFMPSMEPIAKEVFDSPLWQYLWSALSYTETYFDSAVRARVQALNDADVARMLFNVRISNAQRTYNTDSTRLSQKTNLANEADRYLANEFFVETPIASPTKEQLRTKLVHYNEYINDTARLWRRGPFEEKFRLASFTEYLRLKRGCACDVRNLYAHVRNRNTTGHVIDLTAEDIDSEPQVIDLTAEDDVVVDSEPFSDDECFVAVTIDVSSDGDIESD